MANGQNDTIQRALEMAKRYSQQGNQSAMPIPQPGTMQNIRQGAASAEEALKNMFRSIANSVPTAGAGTVPQTQAAMESVPELANPQIPVVQPEMANLPDQQLPTADASQFQAPPAPYSQADLEQKFMETAAMANRPQGIQTTPVGKEFQVLQEEMASLDKKPTGSTELERSLSLDPMQNLQEEVLARTQESLAALDNTTEKIQPGKFWSELPTWQKVVAGLSMALGSITPQGAANVQKIWSNAIDRDIDAQKANLNRKDNLFTKYYNVLKDMKAAELATRVAQLNQIKTKAMLLKEKAMTPLAQRNMALTNEALSQQIQENSIKLMQSIKRMKAMEALGQGQGAMDIRNLPPEWKPYAVQDFGLSIYADSGSKTIEKDISEFRKEVTLADQSFNNGQEALKMVQDYQGGLMPGLSFRNLFDPEFKGKLNSIITQMTLNKLQQIRGAASDRDMKLIEQAIQNPNLFTTRIGDFKGAVQNLLEDQAIYLMSKANQLGFKGDNIPTKFKNLSDRTKGFYQEQFKRGL